MDLVLRSRRVVLPDGERPASVRVVDGRIAAIGPYDVPGEEVEVLLPGLVDTHVHVNEPGRTEWEGFATATRAAAAGGVTTIVDMPLNSLPPTVDAAALAVKRQAAEGRISVDVGFWGGAVPTNLADLRGLHTAGVYGFKCFLADSGVEEFPDLSWPQLSAVLAELGTFGGLLIVHAEDAATLAASPEAHGGRYADFVASRPDEVEENAVTRLLAEARATGARVHILHLSSARTLPAIAAAKADGVRVTVETCPHYLTLTAEEVPDGATAFKCCPPVRGEANRDLLWQALADGTIDCVVSDHSPSPPELKTDDFGTAWGGIASLQLGLPLIWTEARRRGHTLADVVRWMSATPARIAGLAGKGAIAVGNDADLVAFAPDARLTVDVRELHHRHPVSPYAGRALDGVVRRTWLRGVPVSATPAGRLLTRGES